MKVLVILDPLCNLKLTWDSTIYLIRELNSRGHQTWTADAWDLQVRSETHLVRTALAKPRNLKKGSWDPEDDYTLDLSPGELRPLDDFNVILIRKEPPFDETYLYMTHLLEGVAGKIPVFNHPRGIRNTNEKLSILQFPQWIPKTYVSSSSSEILDFQHAIQTDLVVKPLNLKGGKGIFRLDHEDRDASAKLETATQNGSKMVMAQEFIHSEGFAHDKRILIFDGKIWGAYERRAPENDFRANVGVGGTYHTTEVTDKENDIVASLIPYLQEQGLLFVGIDVLQGMLTEINVTCSAGLCEMKTLYPSSNLVGEWADFLERAAQ